MTPDADLGLAPEPLLSLRERRRRATATEINEAALSLFETKGVEQTTVAEISRAAGISKRTFFRYFETKELAALAGVGWARAVEEWAQQEPEDGEDALVAMLTMLEGALRTADRSGSVAHLLRVRRLLDREPSIRIASLRASDENLRMAAAALRKRDRGRYGELEVIVLSRIVAAAVDGAVDYWRDLIETGHPADLVTVFRAACQVAHIDISRVR